jgi:transposase-like protein
VISDGMHRLHAHRGIGSKNIPVDVWPASNTGAVYLDALRTATQSAAPLTRAEKQAAVRRLVADGHGQRAIGRLLGIPTSTISDWVSGSGHQRRTGRASRQSLSRAADQLAKALDAIERAADDHDLNLDVVLAALIEALEPNKLELLEVLVDAVREEQEL